MSISNAKLMVQFLKQNVMIYSIEGFWQIKKNAPSIWIVIYFAKVGHMLLIDNVPEVDEFFQNPNWNLLKSWY